MRNLKLAVDLSSLRLPFRKALDAAAQLGVEGVQIDARGEVSPGISRTGLREVRKLLGDRTLRAATVVFRMGRGFATAEHLERRMEAVRAAMQLAFDLGAAYVLTHVGRIPKDETSPAWRLLVDVLADLGRWGQRVGTTLATEAGSETAEDLARLLRAIPERSLAVDLNPGKLLAAGLSPTEVVSTLGQAIVHVQATDAVRDLAGTTTELVALGEGAVDFPALLGALEEKGYRGYITVQALSQSDPVSEARRSIATLGHLVYGH
jgi:sugar phosphate isomerase/epimerase